MAERLPRMDNFMFLDCCTNSKLEWKPYRGKKGEGARIGVCRADYFRRFLHDVLSDLEKPNTTYIGNLLISVSRANGSARLVVEHPNNRRALELEHFGKVVEPKKPKKKKPKVLAVDKLRKKQKKKK